MGTTSGRAVSGGGDLRNRFEDFISLGGGVVSGLTIDQLSGTIDALTGTTDGL